MLPKISALICTMERPARLETAVRSVLASNYPGPIEIIVLDDASGSAASARSRAFVEGLRASGVDAFYFRNHERRGIFYGRSLLASKMAADSSYALVMDDDIEAEPGCLEKMLDVMSSVPGAGISGPRVVPMSDHSVTAHCASFVNPWTGAYSARDSESPIKCDWLLSGFLLVKREALAATGGFYAGFYISHAEVDFCLAAARAGYSSVYCPSVTILHDETPGQFKRDRMYYVYRNKLLVIHRNFAFPRNVVALFYSGLLALPLHLLESLRYNRGLCAPELRLIFLAHIHGLLGAEGPLGGVAIR